MKDERIACGGLPIDSTRGKVEFFAAKGVWALPPGGEGGILKTLLSALAAGALCLLSSLPSTASDDPFLWLEERTGDRALAWVGEQNAATAEEISSDPRFEAWWRTTLDLFSAEDRIPYVYQQGRYLYNFWQDGTNVLGVWRRTTYESYRSARPDWETIIDFDQLAAREGTDWVFGYAECLWPDYDRCLVTMSPDGGDAVEIREFDLKTKAFVADGFVSPVSKSSFSWLDRDRVVVSAAYAADEVTTSGYPRVIKVLERGQKLEDARTVFAGDVDDLSAGGWSAGDGESLLVWQDIDFYNSAIYLIGATGHKRRIPLPTDLALSVFFQDQMIFAPRSRWTAPDGTVAEPGGLYAFSYGDWFRTNRMGNVATLMKPSARVSIATVASTRDRLFVSTVDNVRARVAAFSRFGGRWTSQTIGLPDNGDITISHTDYEGSSVSFGFMDFLTPPSLIWSTDNGGSLETLKTTGARFDASPFMSEQFEATSADGTRVPYFVVRRKDQSGPVPTLMYGYGGFEVSLTPWYSSIRGKLWLEQGNAWVLANIRGGGEFGPEWHQAALKENRQRAYDDFAAIAEDLVARGITTASQLGIMGGSNGGLLTGVMLTQRPELFGAVISQVPLLDMLRYTELPPGASWIAEYGDPAIPEEAAYIEKYSPYQNVAKDRSYPPALFTTSTADDRVHPGHARKMAALMQSLGHPARFNENTQGGHGGSGDLRPQAMIVAMEYLFLQRALEGEANHPQPVTGSRKPVLEVSDRALFPADASAESGVDCAQIDVVAQAARRMGQAVAGLRTRHAELSRDCRQSEQAVSAPN
ncbi:MAG: prolyl oligopeptidase family protein [Rhizobiaceae bacterium]